MLAPELAQGFTPAPTVGGIRLTGAPAPGEPSSEGRLLFGAAPVVHLGHTIVDTLSGDMGKNGGMSEGGTRDTAMPAAYKNHA